MSTPVSSGGEIATENGQIVSVVTGVSSWKGHL